jgi:hypothetical protein
MHNRNVADSIVAYKSLFDRRIQVFFQQQKTKADGGVMVLVKD